ncbi:MAG: helix-turn-helix transcriptional regulator [Fluviicola sp.]
MSKNLNAIPRYRTILRLLRRQGKYSSRDIHQACISNGIEVEYRTIQNDLQNLKDDPTILGYELNIEYDTRSRKWFSDNIPKEIFTLLELKDGEVTALLFYAKTMSQYSEYPFFKELSIAIRKVLDSANISDNLKQLFEAKSLETEKHLPVEGVELIPDILQAIHFRKEITIDYKKHDHELKTHVIRPILLKEDKKLWYVVGIKPDHDHKTTFALDRIMSIELTDNEFEPIEFNSEDYFKYSFGITVPEDDPVKVILSFDPLQGNYIRTLPIHSTQEILTDNENEFRIQVTVRPSYEFYSTIRSYGEAVKVIEPEFVSNEILKSLINTVELYKKK